jgi:hypothetical protein
MDPYSFDTAGLDRCLVMVFAGATNLVDFIRANIQAVEANTKGSLGVIALIHLPGEETRVSLFRGGTRMDATGIDPDLDLGTASVIQTFFTRSLLSLPTGCKVAAGFRGHGTGTVTLADRVESMLRRLHLPNAVTALGVMAEIVDGRDIVVGAWAFALAILHAAMAVFVRRRASDGTPYLIFPALAIVMTAAATPLPVPAGSTPSLASAPECRMALATLDTVPSPPTATIVVQPDSSAAFVIAASSPRVRVDRISVTPCAANAAATSGIIFAPPPANTGSPSRPSAR